MQELVNLLVSKDQEIGERLLASWRNAALRGNPFPGGGAWDFAKLDQILAHARSGAKFPIPPPATGGVPKWQIQEVDPVQSSTVAAAPWSWRYLDFLQMPWTDLDKREFANFPLAVASLSGDDDLNGF